MFLKSVRLERPPEIMRDLADYAAAEGSCAVRFGSGPDAATKADRATRATLRGFVARETIALSRALYPMGRKYAVGQELTKSDVRAESVHPTRADIW
jgi:hypothetical protein